MAEAPGSRTQPPRVSGERPILKTGRATGPRSLPYDETIIAWSPPTESPPLCFSIAAAKRRWREGELSSSGGRVKGFTDKRTQLSVLGLKPTDTPLKNG